MGNYQGIGRFINCPTPTARIYLEDMHLIDLLNQKIQGEEDEGDTTWKRNETSPYLWQLSEKCLELIKGSEIYGPINGDENDDDYDEHFDFRETESPLYTKS